MKLKVLTTAVLLGIVSTWGCSKKEDSKMIDHQLGVISAFSEMVAADVKQLALSSPMLADEADQIYPMALEIADGYGVQIFREDDLIVTDLFPDEVAAGKEVFIMYKGSTLNAYKTLKSDLSRIDRGDQDEREKIARRFGRLLSYSPQKINSLLADNTDFRTMKDFGITACNIFLYYGDMAAAEKFYSDLLGLQVLARFDNAVILKVAASSTITLVDAAKGMHSAEEPKTVAIALLTRQLKEWYDYLVSNGVQIKYPYKSSEGSAHDGFVAVDPEGYLLEFETFKQHPENERFIPVLDQNKDYKVNLAEQQLAFNSSIYWVYHKDLLNMQHFYEEVLGLEMVADQGWTKIYQVSSSGFIGLVDERRGMHSFTEEKAVTLSFLIDDLDGWHDYVTGKGPFELRSNELSDGPENRYRAFVGFGPEGYFLEFDKFYPHSENDELLKYLSAER